VEEDKYPQLYEELREAIERLYEWHRSLDDTVAQAKERIATDVRQILEDTEDA
jgi:hypothetical protein